MKKITLFLAALLMICPFTAINSGSEKLSVHAESDKLIYSANDLTKTSDIFNGELSITPKVGTSVENADAWIVNYSANTKNGQAVAAPVNFELKIIKSAGENMYGDEYSTYLDYSFKTEFNGKTLGGTRNLERKHLKDSSGATYAGAFTLVLFAEEADGRKVVASKKFNVEPLVSEYTKIDDFSNIVGSNYVNSKSVSPLQMWMEFDEKDIEKDLFYAKALGLNTLRVFLHDLAYRKNKTEFLENIEKFLTIADKNGFKTLFVFFDDCHKTDKEACLDFTPVFESASKWPNAPFPEDRIMKNYPAFSGYVKDVITAHREDDRVFGWDMWNEPWWAILPDSKWKNETIDLHKNAFNWARECSPTQPVMGVYIGKKYSDCDERHTYGEIGTASHAPEYDTEPITSNTLYTEAGNKVWGTSNNSCGSPMEYIAWLTERRSSGLGTPGVFLSWELMNSLTMMNVCNRPGIGLVEPPTVSSGMVFSDGTPCLLSEVAAIREYTQKQKLYLELENFENLDISGWTAESGDWQAVHYDWRATDTWKHHRIKDLNNMTPDDAIIYKKKAYKDYFVEATVKINNFSAEGAGFLLRYDGDGNGYYVGFNLQELFIEKLQNGVATKVASVSVEDTNVWSGWHNVLRVSIKDNKIDVYLNPYSYEASIGDVTKPSESSARKAKLTYVDEQRLFRTGGVGLMTKNTWAQFDDFVVMDYSIAVAEVFGRQFETASEVPPSKPNTPAIALGCGIGGAAIAGGGIALTVALKKKSKKNTTRK